jgi:hypothetical protein
MGFWSAIFGGSDPTLNKDIAQSGQQASWDTGQGQSDTLAGTDFLKSIIGGDATKTAQALAPEISAGKTSAAQDIKTADMFGNRSGGTAAANAATTDKLHGYITNLIGQLTGTAATTLPSIGTNLTSQGTAATAQEAQLSQQRMQNWLNSILGKGIGSAAGAAESYGLGKLFPASTNQPQPGPTPSASPGSADSFPDTISTDSGDSIPYQSLQNLEL